ncbi:MAG: hypothetical protein ACR2H4_18745 [Pyrinomonadaceae bacterium]
MAKYSPRIGKAIAAVATQLDFVGADQVVVLSAEAFLVGRGEDIFHLGFYQNQVPDLRGLGLGQTAQTPFQKTKCVARIALSPIAYTKLLQSMAETAGFVLQPSEESK